MNTMKPPGMLATYRDAFTAVFGPRFWKRVRNFIAAVIVFVVFRSAVADWSEVPSASMVPTLLVGDRIYVNKLAYDLKFPFTTLHLFTWGQPRRGEVIIFFSPANGLRLVKRVIGVPGDLIELRQNELYVNGAAARYDADDGGAGAPLEAGGQPAHIVEIETAPSPAPSHRVMTTPGIKSRRSFGPVRIPPGKYFVLGDNRDDSLDSRFFGVVDRGQIVGRTSLVVWSMDSSHLLLPRWGRFFVRVH